MLLKLNLGSKSKNRKTYPPQQFLRFLNIYHRGCRFAVALNFYPSARSQDSVISKFQVLNRSMWILKIRNIWVRISKCLRKWTRRILFQLSKHSRTSVGATFYAPSLESIIGRHLLNIMILQVLRKFRKHSLLWF
jgi:hypothetical protein